MTTPVERYRQLFGIDPQESSEEGRIDEDIAGEPTKQQLLDRHLEGERSGGSLTPPGIPGISTDSLTDKAKSISEQVLNSEGFSTATIGVGSVVGTRYTPKVMNPVAQTVLLAIGGAIGAAAGAVFPDATRETARNLGLNVKPARNMKEQLRSAVTEGVLDLGFTAGAAGLGHILRGGGSILGRIISQNTNDRALAKEVQDTLGIDLIPTAKGFGVPDVFKAVFGRFPLLRTPIVKGSLRTMKGVSEATDRLWAQIGPSANLAKLGYNVNRIATARYKKFRNRINEAYDIVLRQGEQQGVMVDSRRIMNGDPATNTKGVITILQEMEARLGASAAAEHPLAVFIRENFTALGSNPVGRDIPIQRYRGLMEQLDQAMHTARKGKFGQFQGFKIKEALEAALQHADVPGQQTPLYPPGSLHPVIERLNQVDQLLAQGIQIFETPSAQIFNRVQRGRFRIGFERQGGSHPTQLFDQLMDLPARKRSGFIKELEDLLGKRTTKALSASWLNKKITDNAITDLKGLENAVRKGENPFDATAIRTAMGLDNIKGVRYQATKEIVENAGVDIKTVKTLVDALEAAGNTVPASISAMAARRGQIGGIRAAIGQMFGAGLLTTAGLASGDILGAVAFGVVIRGLGRIMTNPNMVGLAKDAVDPRKGMARRKAALRILAAAAGPIDQSFVEKVREGRQHKGPVIPEVPPPEVPIAQ